MDTMGYIYPQITVGSMPLNISRLPEDGDTRSAVYRLN